MLLFNTAFYSPPLFVKYSSFARGYVTACAATYFALSPAGKTNGNVTRCFNTSITFVSHVRLY